MSEAGELIENAKRIRQRLRYPPNAVHDYGIDLTRKSTAHKGSEINPDPPVKKALSEPKIEVVQVNPYPEIKFPTRFDNILDVVGEFYGISPMLMKSAIRRSAVCFARFVVVYLSLRLLPVKSMASIGRSLNKDHTSILHARKRINEIIAGNTKVAAEIAALEKKIESIHNNRFTLPSIGQPDMAGERKAGLSV